MLVRKCPECKREFAHKRKKMFDELGDYCIMCYYLRKHKIKAQDVKQTSMTEEW